MATPQEKLAQSLEVLKKLQKDKEVNAFKSAEISRVHRERLLKNGFIKEVLKGCISLYHQKKKKVTVLLGIPITGDFVRATWMKGLEKHIPFPQKNLWRYMPEIGQYLNNLLSELQKMLSLIPDFFMALLYLQ